MILIVSQEPVRCVVRKWVSWSLCVTHIIGFLLFCFFVVSGTKTSVTRYIQQANILSVTFNAGQSDFFITSGAKLGWWGVMLPILRSVTVLLQAAILQCLIKRLPKPVGSRDEPLASFLALPQMRDCCSVLIKLPTLHHPHCGCQCLQAGSSSCLCHNWTLVLLYFFASKDADWCGRITPSLKQYRMELFKMETVQFPC